MPSVDLDDDKAKGRITNRRPFCGPQRLLAAYGIWLVFCLLDFSLGAAESWQTALMQMPLASNVTELNRTNCVGLMLRAFQSNGLVKALIFMPGATDELYMFRRAKAALTNFSPSLLDGVNALTNQTFIRATFRPPFLLLHSDEDLLEPFIHIEHSPTATKFKSIPFTHHVVYEDRDWDFVQPMLKKALKADVRPWPYSYDSWHFYRHSLAGWDLNGWEALEAIALAGKTSFTVRRNRDFLVARPQVIFEGDKRARATPKLDRFPR